MERKTVAEAIALLKREQPYLTTQQAKKIYDTNSDLLQLQGKLSDAGIAAIPSVNVLGTINEYLTVFQDHLYCVHEGNDLVACIKKQNSLLAKDPLDWTYEFVHNFAESGEEGLDAFVATLRLDFDSLFPSLSDNVLSQAQYKGNLLLPADKRVPVHEELDNVGAKVVESVSRDEQLDFEHFFCMDLWRAQGSSSWSNDLLVPLLTAFKAYKQSDCRYGMKESLTGMLEELQSNLLLPQLTHSLEVLTGECQAKLIEYSRNPKEYFAQLEQDKVIQISGEGTSLTIDSASLSPSIIQDYCNVVINYYAPFSVQELCEELGDRVSKRQARYQKFLSLPTPDLLLERDRRLYLESLFAETVVSRNRYLVEDLHKNYLRNVQNS